MYKDLPMPDLSHFNHAFRALESALRNIEILDDRLFRVRIQAQSREYAAESCSAAIDCLHSCLANILKITPLRSRAE